MGGHHIPQEDVQKRLRKGGEYKLTVWSGQSAWNPASTKNLIWGPCEVTYLRNPGDRGVTATVEEFDEEDE